MKQVTEKLKAVSTIQIVALVLIIVGLVIIVPKTRGMLDFYREVRYAEAHNFQAGNLSPDLLRPWMTIRTISVAYAVPEKYLFDAANIQPLKETSLIALIRLNDQMHLGMVAGQPALMKTISAAIMAYRAHPVATGLIEKRVQDWMNVAYIANSAGIPAETILQSAGIPVDGNAYKTLSALSSSIQFPGGSRALLADIQKLVDAQGVKPVAP